MKLNQRRTILILTQVSVKPLLYIIHSVRGRYTQFRFHLHTFYCFLYRLRTLKPSTLILFHFAYLEFVFGLALNLIEPFEIAE